MGQHGGGHGCRVGSMGVGRDCGWGLGVGGGVDIVVVGWDSMGGADCSI